MSRPRRRVLLVGWDAADWKVARPLMAEGTMPCLARLVETGASGNLGTLEPPLSPMLWTSIATGKRPTRHGIHGFNEPTPDGQGVRPITILGRTTKAVWNILNQNGVRPCVVGWWPSHPAEPVNGVIVSNFYTSAGDGPEPLPLPPGAVHPPGWADRLAALRVVPMELPGEVIRLFVPEYDRIDQDRDKRLHSLGKVIAETMTVHAAATEILEHAEWDFAAIYYNAIDHVCHAFMPYHPPKLPWVNDQDFAIYQHVVNQAYRYSDAMLGRLLELAGPDTTVIVMSDHGFHPDDLRPGYVPAEAAGPAIEHRSFGMVTLNGPGIKAGETLYGASLLDITPTILHLFGQPVGRDMDGKVLVTALERPGQVVAIDTWDAVDGDSGTHPPGMQVDPIASAEAMKQMVALGYVAPPGEDAARNVAECLAELRYNLARAHDDAGRYDLSQPLYEALYEADPDDHRYVERLVGVLIELNEHARALALLDAFDARCEANAPAAQAELVRRRTIRSDTELKPSEVNGDQRDAFERRQLVERATGFVMLRQILRLQTHLAGRQADEARRDLEALEALCRQAARIPAMFLARAFARLGDDDRALEYLRNALERDPEDWQAWALAGRLHLRNRRFAAALDAAAASLALIYFQPVTHFVMGRALAARGDLEGAERALRVAVTQAPGLVPAHQALARLYARLGRPIDADIHRTRASELRRRATERKHAQPQSERGPSSDEPNPLPERPGTIPADPECEIVVVAGLPRSGTSMLMQLLTAGGVPPLTDGRREADTDNPRGYFEFEAATRLARDASWIPQARGKAVKLALPLVPHLPAGQSYRLIVIERDPRDVIASQRAMLRRLDRVGSSLDDELLIAEYSRQRARLRLWLERRSEVAVLPLRYEAVLADPTGTATRIAAFLSRPFDTGSAAPLSPPSYVDSTGAAESPGKPRSPRLAEFSPRWVAGMTEFHRFR